jgi:hypothetical protein
MTQQNAALVEQSAAAAESLREQAHKLAGAVAGFKLDGSTRVPSSGAIGLATPPVPAFSQRSKPTQAPLLRPAKPIAPAPQAAAAQAAIDRARESAIAPATAKTPAAVVSPAATAEPPADGEWESF